MATMGVIYGRILHIEPIHRVFIERHKMKKKKKKAQRRVYTGPRLTVYELMLRKPRVIMVNIKAVNRTFERKLDFPCSRVWVITIGCSERTVEKSNFWKRIFFFFCRKPTQWDDCCLFQTVGFLWCPVLNTV